MPAIMYTFYGAVAYCPVVLTEMVMIEVMEESILVAKLILHVGCGLSMTTIELAKLHFKNNTLVDVL